MDADSDRRDCRSFIFTPEQIYIDLRLVQLYHCKRGSACAYAVYVMQYFCRKIWQRCRIHRIYHARRYVASVYLRFIVFTGKIKHSKSNRNVDFDFVFVFIRKTGTESGNKYPPA